MTLNSTDSDQVRPAGDPLLPRPGDLYRVLGADCRVRSASIDCHGTEWRLAVRLGPPAEHDVPSGSVRTVGENAIEAWIADRGRPGSRRRRGNGKE